MSLWRIDKRHNNILRKIENLDCGFDPSHPPDNPSVSLDSWSGWPKLFLVILVSQVRLYDQCTADDTGEGGLFGDYGGGGERS